MCDIDEALRYAASLAEDDVIVETLDILGDPTMVAALRRSLDDLERGRLISNAEAKTRLGLLR